MQQTTSFIVAEHTHTRLHWCVYQINSVSLSTRLFIGPSLRFASWIENVLQRILKIQMTFR